MKMNEFELNTKESLLTSVYERVEWEISHKKPANKAEAMAITESCIDNARGEIIEREMPVWDEDIARVWGLEFWRLQEVYTETYGNKANALENRGRSAIYLLIDSFLSEVVSGETVAEVCWRNYADENGIELDDMGELIEVEELEAN